MVVQCPKLSIINFKSPNIHQVHFHAPILVNEKLLHNNMTIQ